MITDTKPQIYERLESISYIYTWGASIVAVSFLCLAQDFINIWAGQDYLLPDLYVIVLFSLFYWGKMFCVPTLFVEAAGLWYESKYINLIAAGFNVIFSILLAKIMGVMGVPIASTIVSLLASMGYLHTLFKYYFEGLNKRKYVLSLVTSMFFQLLMAGTIYLVTNKIHVDSVVSFLLKAVVVVILSISFFYIFGAIDKKRFQKALPFIKKMIRI